MHRLTPTHRLLLLLAFAVAGFGGLAWPCRTSPGMRFLPARAPAEWIVYPNPPDIKVHAEVDSTAVFRRVFRLDAGSSQESLTFCALRGVSGIQVNGRAISIPAAPSRDWKQPVELDLAGALHAGDNEVSVAVTGNDAPPALWALLRAGGVTVPSDATWEVSWAGAAWRPARLARDPMPIGAGSPLAGGPEPLESLRVVWPALALMAVIAAVVIAALRRGFKFLPLPAPTLALGLFILMWVALFANNLRSLPREAGFDVNAHIDYIQYLLSHGRLPRADEGFEMYQPPLYYAVCAALLGALGLGVDGTGLAVLHQLGLAFAIANLVLVRKGLALVFPDDARKQIVGLTAAAFLPASLCLSQFITNEVLAATLVTASLYLCLLIVRSTETPGWKMFAGLGLCLGAALLAKLTAVLALPVVFGALLLHAASQRAPIRNQWLVRAAAAGALCLAVGGWPYARLWAQYGSPLVVNWDAALGFRWWQDDGLRTAAYYLRFGAAFEHPWFSAFYSFPDGIYTTLWGDGLLGGATAWGFRLPWSYPLMAAGYLLALVPTLLLLAGAVSAVARFVRAPRAELVILHGYGVVALAALVWVTLETPYVSVVKSFFLLSAMLPFCTLIALGWDAVVRRSRIAAAVAGVALGVWALASFCSFWIRAGSSLEEGLNGLNLWKQKHYSQAIDLLSRAVRADDTNLAARSLLAEYLGGLGRWDESLETSSLTVSQYPGDGVARTDHAAALSEEHRLDEAIAEARRAVALAPDYAPAHTILALLLRSANKSGELAQACREGLRVAPLDATLHDLLGLALMMQAQSDAADASALIGEACDQLTLAVSIDPTLADARTNLDAALRQRERAGDKGP